MFYANCVSTVAANTTANFSSKIRSDVSYLFCFYKESTQYVTPRKIDFIQKNECNSLYL